MTKAKKVKPDIPTFAKLARESMAAGMSRESAEAHARKILASYDQIEVDPRTGKWRYATGGPSIFDVAKTPTPKAPPKKKSRR